MINGTPQNTQEASQLPPVQHNSISNKVKRTPLVLNYLETYLGGDMKTKNVSYDE